MLTYEELTDICEKKNTTITEVSNRISMSLNGLRKAMRNSALTADKLILVCKVLDITPNYFFGIEAQSGDTIYGSQNKGGKKQIIQQGGIEELRDTIALLKDQLATKDLQIAEKDKQISKLLGL